MMPWVVRVMSYYGGLPYAVGVLIFIAMSLFLGLYGALFAFAFWRIRPGASFGRWLLVPLAWAAVEDVRTYLFAGFPWSFIAASIVDYTSLVQFDRVAGPYALGVLILLPSTLIAWLVVDQAARPNGVQRLFAVASVIIVTFVWWSTGYIAPKVFVRPNESPTSPA